MSANNICIAAMIIIAIIGFISKIKTIRKDRKKELRRIFFPFVGQISFALILLIGSFLGIFIGINYIESQFHYLGNDLIISATSLTVWIFLIRITFRPFLVSVPAFVGLVTESLLSGEYFTYPMGIHIKYPWEVAKRENYFSLEIITVPFFEDFVAKDGGVVMAKASFRYRADFDNLAKYAQIAESTIVIGFANLAKGLLTSEIAKRDADKARKETADIKKAIEQLYIEEGGRPKLTSKDEKSFGVQFEDFTLADIGYGDKTQEALTSEFNRKVLARTTNFNKLPPKTREDAMILQGIIKKNVNKIDITGVEGLSAIATTILAATEGFFDKRKTSEKNKKKGGGK